MAKLEIELLKTKSGETSQFTRVSKQINSNCKQQWQELIVGLAGSEQIDTKAPPAKRNQYYHTMSPNEAVHSLINRSAIRKKGKQKDYSPLQNLYTESDNLVDTENNLFHMPGMKLSSPRIFTKDIQTKQDGEDYSGNYEKRSVGKKLLTTIGLAEKKPQNYFDHWRLYAEALKKALKKRGSYGKQHSEKLKQFIDFIDKKELEAKYTLLKVAYEESENTAQRLAKVNNLKLTSMPAMDFTESFSRKEVLDKVRKVHNKTEKRIRSLSKQINERNAEIRNQYLQAINKYPTGSSKAEILNQRLNKQLQHNEALKNSLIKQVKYSHSMGKLWLDTLEKHASKSSRAYISKLRHFAHGILGLMAFACLVTVITAGIIMSGPFAPVILLTAGAVFAIATKIGLVCAVLSFGFLASEMITNKIYYHQNPSINQTIQLGITITFASMGFAIKSIGSAVMWLTNSLTKLFLQTTKGIPKNTSEIKHSITGHKHIKQSSSAFILQKTQKVIPDPQLPIAINTDVTKKDIRSHKKQQRKTIPTFPGFMQSRRKVPVNPPHYEISHNLSHA